MIMEIVLLFLPGIVSVLIYSRLQNEKWKCSEYIGNYAVFSFLIYFLNSTSVYLRGWEEYSLRTIGFYAQIKYGILGLVFAIALPYLLFIGKKVLTRMRNER